MERQVSCQLCGQLIKSEDFEKHLLEYHFMSYEMYYELISLSKSKMTCWRCGVLRYPIMPYSDIYMLPCLKCAPPEQLKDIYGSILESLDSYIRFVKSDRSIQMLLCNDILLKNLFPHTISEFKAVFDTLKNGYGRLNKSMYLEISRKYPYVPFEISVRNSKNLQLDIYNKVLSEDTIILGGENYRVLMPEPCEYDQKHHSKHSILNYKSQKTTKKIKLNDKSCFKLWGTSIFQLIKCDSKEPVNISDLSGNDRVILKSYILGNRKLINILTKIYLEICKFCDILCDNVFIKNSIPLSTGKNVKVFHFSWFQEESQWNTESIVNLTVL